jgi:hypothetical protein
MRKCSFFFAAARRAANNTRNGADCQPPLTAKFSIDDRLACDVDQFPICERGQLARTAGGRPETCQEEMFEPHRPAFNHDPKTGVPLGELGAELSHAFDQRTDDLARLLAVINRHQVVHALGVKWSGLATNSMQPPSGS